MVVNLQSVQVRKTGTDIFLDSISDADVGDQIDFVLTFDGEIVLPSLIYMGGSYLGITSGRAFAGSGSNYFILRATIVDNDHDRPSVNFFIDGGVTDTDGIQVARNTVIVTGSDGTTAFTALLGEPPEITSDGGGAAAAISVDENTTVVTTVEATDINASEAANLTYSITGGADQARFTIDPATGVLSFVAAPDFETPGDVGMNNVYDVEVTVSDPAGRTDTQSIAVTVLDADDPSIITITALSGTAVQGAMLSVPSFSTSDQDGLGSYDLAWLRDGTLIDGATGYNYVLMQQDVGARISLRVTLIDAKGNIAFKDSDPTAEVTNVNDAPTGAVTISGTAIEDGVLTAGTGTIADEDGLGAFSYQWLRDGSAISGADQVTYMLGQVDVGAEISVRVDYTDGFGVGESLTSGVTAAVENVNDPPTGGVSITGSPVRGQTVTADTSTLDDEDGLGALSYQWLRNGTAISGADGALYKLSNADAGKSITVNVTYTDGQGTDESVTSDSVSPTRFADSTLKGTGRADRLAGRDGDDVIVGRGGNDKLLGRAGDDVIKGGRGSDMIVGGAGDDVLTGGKGQDMFVFRQNNGRDVITDFEVGKDIILLRGALMSGTDVTVSAGKGGTLIEFGKTTIYLQDTALADFQGSGLLIEL